MVRRSAQRSGDLSSAAGSRRTRIASMPFFSNSVAIPPHRHFARAFHASSLAALSSSSAASSAFSHRVRRRVAASAESRSGTSILRDTSNSLEALRPETGVSRAKVTGGAHFVNWAAHGFGGNASGSTGTRRGVLGGRPAHARDTSRNAAAFVEGTVFPGRSVDAKRRLYRLLVENLEQAGVPRDRVLTVLHEPPLENWGIRGGQAANDVQLGFKTEV